MFRGKLQVYNSSNVPKDSDAGVWGGLHPAIRLQNHCNCYNKLRTRMSLLLETKAPLLPAAQQAACILCESTVSTTVWSVEGGRKQPFHHIRRTITTL